VGLVQLNANAVAALGSKNLVYTQDTGIVYPVLSVPGHGSQLPGDAVCRMGYGTWNKTKLATGTGQGRTCGTITEVIDESNLSCETGHIAARSAM
jgi:hypothetical protein